MKQSKYKVLFEALLLYLLSLYLILRWNCMTGLLINLFGVEFLAALINTLS